MSIQLFKQYTQAMADSDWNTIASMYAEDCVSVDPDGAVFKGREANLANDQKWASMMSDFKFNYANTVESGKVTVVEMEITGTMTGEMPMPDGTSIPPTGKTPYIQSVHDNGMGSGTNQKTKNICGFCLVYGRLWNHARLVEDGVFLSFRNGLSSSFKCSPSASSLNQKQTSSFHSSQFGGIPRWESSSSRSEP